jgi:hypothetical protein
MSDELRTLVVALGLAAASIFAIATLALGVKAAMRGCVHAGMRVPAMLKKRLMLFFAWTHKGKLFVETPDVSIAIPLQEIAEVQYHSHAAIGFLAWFEFIYGEGRSLVVDACTRGIMNDVIPALENALPGFSGTAVEECMENGDVEDRCVIWKAR